MKLQSLNQIMKMITFCTANNIEIDKKSKNDLNEILKYETDVNNPHYLVIQSSDGRTFVFDMDDMEYTDDDDDYIPYRCYATECAISFQV